MNEIEISHRMKQVYISNQEIGAYFPDYYTWYRSARMFYPAGPGGIAFTAHSCPDDFWWITVYCPGSWPTIKELRNLVKLAMAGGCKLLAANFNMEKYRSADRVTARKLEVTVRRLGFKLLGDNLYAYGI
jgi:hypothetical protein